MMLRISVGALALAVVGMVLLGVTAPKPAHANDAGRIIAGLAVGALVYEMLDNDSGRGRDRGYYDNGRWSSPNQRGCDRGYYSGNRGNDYRAPHHQQIYREGYSDGYHNGWNNGANYGYNRGWNQGYNYGYDRGYDRGYGNGYSDGSWNTWNWNRGGCW